MRRVIKNQKKMKNTMYIVFGVFALALFGVTMLNPSYAEEGLIIDDALDVVVQQITSGSGGFEKVEEEKMIQPVGDDESEDEDVVESEVTSVEEIEEGDEDSQDLDDVDLKGKGEDDEVSEEASNEADNNENKTEQKEIEENISTEENSQDNENNIFENNGLKIMNHSLITFSDSLQNNENNINDEIELIGGDNHMVWNKTKGLITVYSGDFSFGFTIQDKNLGTDEEHTGGAYFQWGNNYGHYIGDETTNKTQEERLEYKEEYDGHGYDGEENKFIAILGYPDIWENNVSYPNLRGGGDDDNITNGYDDINHKATNLTQRQGPCEQSFHIPSAGERGKLTQMYNLVGNDLKNDLKLPVIGGIGGTNISYNQFPGLGYWTSSPGNAPYNAKSYWGYINTFPEYNRSQGMPIRCFKNEYTPYLLPVKFNPNGGVFSGMDVDEVKIYKYEANENGIIPIYNIQIPDRKSNDMSQQSGWMFAGWHTKDGTNGDWGEEFDVSNPNSTIAYAKWLPFNDLKLDEIGLPGVTIMDRNLGAEDFAEGIHIDDNNGNIESIEKQGLRYQWGNNYGFKYEGAENIEIIENNNGEQMVDGDIYGKNNYYYSNIFKINKNSNQYAYNNWWNMRGGNDNSEESKKGPCPEGYHIPTKDEYKVLIKLFQQNDCGGLNRYKCFTKKLKIPFGNGLSYTDGNQSAGNGYPYSETNKGGDYTTLWTSTTTDIKTLSYYLYLSKNSSSMISYFNTYGSPIRCFKNSENKNNLIIDYDNGEENQIYKLYRWESIKNYKPSSNPQKNGYNFKGWKYEDNGETTEFESDEYINKNTVIKANWEKNPWYIFNSNKGIFINGATVYTKKYEKEKIDTRYSHTDNINDDGINNGSYTNIIYNKTGIITITGAIKLELTIKYYGNKSSDGDDFLMIWTGTHNNYSYEGNNDTAIFNLSGWDDNVFHKYELDGDSITYQFKSYPNSYGPNYGYYIKITGYKYNNHDSDLIPIRLGYEFLGRYETGALEPFDFTGTEVTQDRTFYAKWNPHHYTIKFNTNEGNGVVNDIDATYGEKINLPIVTRDGYIFKGWESEDGVTYNNIIPEGTGVTTKDGVIVTLTAQWEKIQESSGNTSSGGGGRKSVPDTSEMDKQTETTAEIAIENEHNSAADDEKGTSDIDKPSLNEETSKEVISVTQETAEDGTEVEVVVEAVTIKNTNIVATVRTETPVNGTNSSSSSSSTHTKEQADAYSFAKSNGITTTESIEHL